MYDAVRFEVDSPDAKPLMKRFNLIATARASYGPYSLIQDTDVLLEALTDAVKLFG